MKKNRFNQDAKRTMKHFSFLIFLFSFFTVSCSKSETVELQGNDETTTFTLSVDQPETPAQAKAATRTASTVTPARYVMEVWNEDGTQPENVFENGTKNHAEITSGSTFTVTLDKTKAYSCLFWADDNATYNAALLKTISLNSGKDAYTEAYHANVSVPKGKNPAVAVMLKRAVAKVTLTETATVKSTEDIALSFTNIYPAFNVFGGEASGSPSEWTKTVTPAAESGLIGTLYFFAKATKELSEMKFTCGAGTEKSVSNVPYQMNYATNIKGEYSSFGSFTFTVTADDDWNAPDNDVNFGKKVYKVGDIYPDAIDPIGVVFWVDENDASYNSTDKTSARGKIVGLNEGTGLAWSTATHETGATITTDGRANMTAIAQYIFDYRKQWNGYPAFMWVAQQNGKTNGGWDGANDKWYLPAKEELKALYGEYNGDTNVNDDVKVAVNATLDTIGGAVKLASNVYYWTSTEDDGTYSWGVSFSSGSTSANYSKTSIDGRVRCIRVF